MADSLESEGYIPNSGEVKDIDEDFPEIEEDNDTGIQFQYSIKIIIFTCFLTDGMESAYVLVNWPELRQLLCKCGRDGCSAFVSPDNLELSRRGIYEL